MKAKGRLLLLSALLAIVTSFLLIQYVKKSVTVETQSAPQVQIVVAAGEIPERVKITKDMLKLQTITDVDAHPLSLRKLDDAVGTISRQRISNGETILSDKIVKDDGNSPFAMKIAKGQRAISLAYNDVMGVGGFLLPGDHVDVVMTYSKDALHGKNDLSKITLQNLQVLAIGQQSRNDGPTDTGQPKDAKDKKEDSKSTQPVKTGTVTLSVKPDQAEAIAFAESYGNVKLLLRGPLDQETPATPGVTNETAASVR